MLESELNRLIAKQKADMIVVEIYRPNGKLTTIRCNRSELGCILAKVISEAKEDVSYQLRKHSDKHYSIACMRGFKVMHLNGNDQSYDEVVYGRRW